jgi:uncharacterized protein YqhQ
MSNHDEKHLVGGQAVIEGVMMKSPNYYSVAVRKSNGEIITKTESCPSITNKYPILKKRFLRGIIILFETMMLGIATLSFSADVYAEDIEGEDKKHKHHEEKKGIGLETLLTLLTSVALGIVLFVLLPLWITNMFKSIWPPFSHSFVFNIFDGLLRLIIFLLYVIGISFLKDIRRVFEYHGAEHKTVYAHEHGEELTIENVKKYSTLHPRCGTNFIFVVIILGIFVISLIPVQGFIYKFLVRILVLPLLASVSYEIIRWLGRHQGNSIADFFMKPGLLLQKLTTQEPDDKQIEVAIVALKEVLAKEKK